MDEAFGGELFRPDVAGKIECGEQAVGAGEHGGIVLETLCGTRIVARMERQRNPGPALCPAGETAWLLHAMLPNPERLVGAERRRPGEREPDFVHLLRRLAALVLGLHLRLHW